MPVTCAHCGGAHPAWECPTPDAFRNRNQGPPLRDDPAARAAVARHARARWVEPAKALGPGEVCPTCGRKAPGRKRLFKDATERKKAHREGVRYERRKGK